MLRIGNRFKLSLSTFGRHHTSASTSQATTRLSVVHDAGSFIQLRSYSKEIKDARPVMNIFFGSQTGTAALYANLLKGKAEEQKWATDLIDLGQYDVEDLVKHRLLVFCISNFGRGEPPDNARKFYNWLMDEKRKSDLNLSKSKFAMFGLGDSKYGGTNYQIVGRRIFQRLKDLGAAPVCVLAEGDASADQDGDFERFSEDFLPTLEQMYSTRLARDAQKVKAAQAQTTNDVIEFEADDPLRHGYINNVTYYKNFDATTFGSHLPYTSRLVTSVQLHSPSSPRSCKHIEFDISKVTMPYLAGDYLGVYPTNNAELVSDVAKYFNINTSNYFTISGGIHALKFPAFLPNPCTIEHALTKFVDLTEPPTKAMLKHMASVATDDNDKKKLESLVALPDKDAELVDAVQYRPNLLEFFKEYPSVKLDFGSLMKLRTATHPRFYSISSSPKLFPDQVHLTVVRNVQERKGHRYTGLSSSMLVDRMKEGDQAQIFVQKSAFKLPEDPSTPVIFFAAGTGIAPFIGFLQDRLADKMQRKSVGPALVFFGCERDDLDYLYREQLADYEKKGICKLVTAFAKQQTAPNGGELYVQHRIWEHRDLVWQLMKDGAWLHVCGHIRLGDGVEQCLIRIIQEKSPLHREADDAKNWLYNNFWHCEPSRYHSDVFA